MKTKELKMSKNKFNLKNANYLACELKYTYFGLTESARIAILACVGKECGFELKREIGYSKTSNERIRKIFGEHLGPNRKHDVWIDYLKSDDELFFSYVYANRGGNGSYSSRHGYLYRGGGFNHLTFLDNYLAYSTDRYNLVKNPELINDPGIASEVCAEYFIKLSRRKSKRLHKLYSCDLENVDSVKKAMQIVLHLNAGIGKSKLSPVLLRANLNAGKWVKLVSEIYENA